MTLYIPVLNLKSGIQLKMNATDFASKVDGKLTTAGNRIILSHYRAGWVI